MLNATELQVNKELTHCFIMSDPTVVSLVPRGEVKTDSGGTKMRDHQPREPQQFKMIHQGGSLGGKVTAEDGVNRRFDFVLVGEWDAIVEINDYWKNPDDPQEYWQVTGIEPYNGYEVKAEVKAYGRSI